MQASHRIWFLNRSYWPDSEATGQLLTELCEDLAGAFDVTVFAGRPNHAEELGDPTARSRHGVDIVRVPHSRFRKSSNLGRLLNLVTFTLCAFFATLFRRRPDVIVTETDPFFLPLLGRWLKFRYRCRFIAYLQDVYPDVAVAVGTVREGWLTRSLRRQLVAACRRADRVIVVSDEMLERCVRNGMDRKRMAVIPNWADCSRIVPCRDNNRWRVEHGWQDKFLVMYSGNLGLAHWLDPLIDVAANLKNDPRFHFVLIGEGVRKAELAARVVDVGLANVTFLPYQPRAFLAHSLSAADVHMVTLHPNVSGCVMPSKLYGIIASGTPVLAVGPRGGDLDRIVKEHEVGLVCPVEGDGPADRTSLADRLMEALLEMHANREELRRQGSRARRLAELTFDRPLQVMRFTEQLRAVLAGAAHAITAAASEGESTWELRRAIETQRDTQAVEVSETLELPGPVTVATTESSRRTG